MKRSFVAETQTNYNNKKPGKQAQTQFVRYRTTRALGAASASFHALVSPRGKGRKQKSTIWVTQNTQNEEENARRLSTGTNHTTTPYGKAGYTLDPKGQEVPLGAGASFVFLCKGFHHLQQLAANEVGPAADLGGDALGAGELLVHALSEELGGLLG